MSERPPWSKIVSLGELGREQRYALEADDAARRRIARLLDLAELSALTAKVAVAPWFDGIQIDGHWSANLVQTCGVSLEPLPAKLEGDFQIRAVPEGSVHAPAVDHEVDLDLDAQDPPDVLESDGVDLAAYVVEDLALNIDPFPRKPGAEFEPPVSNEETSPFAVLRALRDPKA